jgi:Zn-dependent protease with chaperone function
VTYLWHHIVTFALAAVTLPALARAEWTQRAPHTSVLLWQSLTLSAVASAVGAFLSAGLAPYQRGIASGLYALAIDLAAGQPRDRLSVWQFAAVAAGIAMGVWLLVVHAHSWRRRVKARRRHQQLLNLVATGEANGHAVVIDHPVAVAYFVPGPGARVVMSSGALHALNPDQREAVLAHETAHARQLHHLALAPFYTLRAALPCRATKRALAEVGLLLEMCADDQAIKRCGKDTLREALRRFDRPGRYPPPGVLSATTGVTARIARLTTVQAPPSAGVRALSLAAATTTLATPLSLFALPF